jgi:hypothetical protein
LEDYAKNNRQTNYKQHRTTVAPSTRHSLATHSPRTSQYQSRPIVADTALSLPAVLHCTTNMPAMWDTFKTGTGPGLHQLPPQELKNRPFLRQNRSSSSGLPQSRSTTSAHSNQTTTSSKSRDDIYDSQTHLHDDFENRLNGLGIQNGPFRYEIRRGKTVRTPDVSGPPRL